MFARYVETTLQEDWASGEGDRERRATAHDGGAQNVRVGNKCVVVAVDEDEDDERSRRWGLVCGKGRRETRSKRQEWGDTCFSAVMNRVNSKCRRG